MSNIPENLRYSKDHEWIEVDGDIATIGITDYAQHALGDVVYIDMPRVGDKFSTHEAFGSVESVKAVSELYLPVHGEVLEVNAALTDRPELVNSDPHGEGWMVVVQLDNPDDASGLMRAADYEQHVKEEGGE